jgi:D-inositol-3-phosphate glycosyltransferase
MLSYHTCPIAILGGKDTGGMNVYVRELVRHLGPLGVHVDVYTRSQDEHAPHVLHDLGYGNRVVHVRSGPEVPLPKQELAEYLPEFVNGIQEFTSTKGLNYDLIHSHYWMSGIAAKELKKDWNIPIIHMYHTLGVMKQRVARNAEEIEGQYRLDGEREVLNIADRIIAATQAEYAQLQWLYGAATEKIVVIPPGVDLSRFYPIPPDEAKEFIGVNPCQRVLLFVGRIEPLKGIDTLMKAIALLRDQGLEICLSIIGGDPDLNPEVQSAEMARLKAIREESVLSDQVGFLGKRAQDTLPYYYSAAEAVVVPSHYESFGMVALEAMACGAPVVASQVGGLAFLVKDGETGYTVPVNNPELLADRLSLLLRDPDLQRKMGLNAFAEAQSYSWEIIAQKMSTLYKQVIDQNGLIQKDVHGNLRR